MNMSSHFYFSRGFITTYYLPSANHPLSKMCLTAHIEKRKVSLSKGDFVQSPFAFSLVRNLLSTINKHCTFRINIYFTVHPGICLDQELTQIHQTSQLKKYPSVHLLHTHTFSCTKRKWHDEYQHYTSHHQLARTTPFGSTHGYQSTLICTKLFDASDLGSLLFRPIWVQEKNTGTQSVSAGHCGFFLKAWIQTKSDAVLKWSNWVCVPQLRPLRTDPVYHSYTSVVSGCFQWCKSQSQSDEHEREKDFSSFLHCIAQRQKNNINILFPL